jgi:23S rRNA-/tRNA-specific pseudouridylate synthase
MASSDATDVSSSDRLKILTVGDGDLTLSLALARAYGSTQLDLTASTLLDTEDDLVRTYRNSQLILTELGERGVPVWFGVDATQLHQYLPSRFDVVLFHHPHLGLDTLLENEEWHAQRHHILMAHYLWSAKHILTDQGRVHVCLCGTQPQTWRVEEAAKRQGLERWTKESTSTPMHTWLGTLVELPVQPHFPAPRKFRNGKLGSKHALGKYGYQHRRTHGDAHDGGGSDMSVSGSVHLVFGNDGSNISLQLSSQEDGFVSLECFVCGQQCESKEALEQHLKSPALPDGLPITTSTSITPTSTGPIISSKAPSVKKHESKREGNVKPVDLNESEQQVLSNVTILCHAIVAQEHGGKRLRWYLRQPVMRSLKPLSKKQCDDLIKGGQVWVNSQVVTDNSRILKIGDSIRVLESVTSTPSVAPVNNPPTVEVLFQEHSLVVAFKPVGMRTLGSFSDTTMEMNISSQVGTPYKSISKLDTGCPGLCVLMHRDESANVEVTHVFTALVHGCVSEEWNQRTEMDLPVESMRRWRNSGDKRSLDDISTSETIILQCLESTASLSTIQIETSSKSSGLCNAICFLLRKNGHPVVNDRFCKQEYLDLPRSMRNTIKGRLCVGCYEVKIDGIMNRIKKTLPERLSAGHWEQHCNNSSTDD